MVSISNQLVYRLIIRVHPPLKKKKTTKYEDNNFTNNVKI